MDDIMKPQEQVKEATEQVIETIVADAPEAPSLTLTPFDQPETKPVLVTDAQKKEEEVEDIATHFTGRHERSENIKTILLQMIGRKHALLYLTGHMQL